MTTPSAASPAVARRRLAPRAARLLLLGLALTLAGCPSRPPVTIPGPGPLAPVPPPAEGEPPRAYLQRLEALAAEPGHRHDFDLAIARLRAELGDVTGAHRRLTPAFRAAPDDAEISPLYFELALAIGAPSDWLAGRSAPAPTDDPDHVARWLIASAGAEAHERFAREAIAARPGDPALSTALAWLALERGDVGRAWLLADDVLADGRAVPPPWDHIARLILLRATIERDPPTVATLLVERPDDSPAMARIRGAFLLENARYVEAHEALDAAARRYPLDRALSTLAARAAAAAAQLGSLDH